MTFSCGMAIVYYIYLNLQYRGAECRAERHKNNMYNSNVINAEDSLVPKVMGTIKKKCNSKCALRV